MLHNYIKAEENARIEREKQLEAEAKVKAEKDAEIRAVNEAATAKRNAEIRAVNEAAAIETAKNKEKADKIAREEAEKQALIKAKKEAEYYKGLSFRINLNVELINKMYANGDTVYKIAKYFNKKPDDIFY